MCRAPPAFVSPAKSDSSLSVERVEGGSAERKSAIYRKRRKIELESEILRKELEIETMRKEVEIAILRKGLERSMLQKALELLELDEMDLESGES